MHIGRIIFLILIFTGLTTQSRAEMVLMGTANKTFFTFPIVTVSLYVSDKNETQNILADIPKRLDVHYHVNVSRQELYHQTIQGIKRNSTHEALMALMPEINQINSYYPDIKAGDSICVTYIPGIGSQVMINGYLKGLVPGADFAKAFFSIWIGKNPVDAKAKYKLLGMKN